MWRCNHFWFWFIHVLRLLMLIYTCAETSDSDLYICWDFWFWFIHVLRLLILIYTCAETSDSDLYLCWDFWFWFIHVLGPPLVSSNFSCDFILDIYICRRILPLLLVFNTIFISDDGHVVSCTRQVMFNLTIYI